jgi:hypothetical protein
MSTNKLASLCWCSANGLSRLLHDEARPNDGGSNVWL